MRYDRYLEYFTLKYWKWNVDILTYWKWKAENENPAMKGWKMKS